MKVFKCHTDKTSRLANGALGQRRGEGGRMKGAPGSLPSEDTARGGGFRVVCWPNLSLALPPTGARLSERSWAWKKPRGLSSRVVETAEKGSEDN